MGTHTTINLDGQEKISSKYLLQRVRIKNGEVIHTIAEENEDNLPNGFSGRIGREVLQTRNLLLDFSRCQLFVLNHFEDLRSEGYSLKDFKEISFEMTRWGAVFAIDTDFGIKRFFINTSMTSSGIKNFSKQSGKGKVKTEKFKIGDFDLGNTDLDVIDISSDLTDVDGYLGIDFFKKNVIYLDFQKSKALLKRNKKALS